MSTGIANINLPIYEVIDGNIKVPISISFSTGGIKVNQLPTCLGIGWNLNCGGMIYQKVNGLDDLGGNEGDIPSSGNYVDPENSAVSPIANQTINTISEFLAYADAPPPVPLPNPYYNISFAKRFLGKIIDGWIDGEADEFKLSLPTVSNTLFFDQQAQEFKTSHIDGLNIYNWPNAVSETWLLKDKTGLDYYFAAPLNYKNPLYYNPHAIPSGYPTNPTDGYFIKNTVLNDIWPLGQIHDVKTDRNVDFIYSRTTTTIPNMNHGSSGYQLGYVQGVLTGINNGISGSVLDFYERQEAQMDEIQFSNGKVQFTYDATQQNQYGPKLLKNIKVVNAANQTIKTISFFYVQKPTIGSGGTIDYVNTCNFLEKITETIIVNSVEQHTDLYKFEYTEDLNFPKRFSFAQDKWGLYNGENQNTTFFPMDVLQLWNAQNAASVGADRAISESHSKQGNLKTVIYPTKGKAEFLYESNMAGVTPWGGLRVKQVNYKPMNGQPDIVSKYLYDNSSVQTINPVYYKQHYYLNSPDNNTIITVTGNSITPTGFNGSNGIFYTKVDDLSDDINQGRTVHNFTVVGELPYWSESDAFAGPKTSNLHEFGPLETRTETFRYNQVTQQEELISRNDNSIVPINDLNTSIDNIHGYWSSYTVSPFALYFAGNDPYSVNPYPTMNMDPFEQRFKFYSDAYLPVERVNTLYESGSLLVNTDEFEYDLQTGLVKLQRKFSSTGDITEIRVKFAKDYTVFNNSSNSWDIMLQNTLAASPIEISLFEKKAGESSFSLTKSTLYKYQNNNIKEVYELETDRAVTNFTAAYNTSSQFVYDSRYSRKFEVLSFDINNNPTLVQDNKKSIAYFYDHNNSYATAMVENAGNLNDVAYTSFETPTTGNWNYAGTLVEPGFTITGKKAYSLSTGNITKANLNSGMQYAVSYWSDNGAKNVSGFSSIAGRTVNGFTYYEHKINAVTSITISGTGNIDELRLYPVTARMVSQTYNPLIGMSSQCDANNRISYYEYDSFNRLAIIRDQDGKVLKKICYNYSGQAEDCNSPCPSNSQPSWQNTGNVRCQVNSSCGYTGYQEVEQQDINSCTNSGTQWILGTYNPTACGTSPYTQVDVVNNSGTSGLYIKYTAVNSPYNEYIFPIPASSGPLGCIPGGKGKPYNIQVYHPGFPPLLTYTLGGTTVSGTPANFNGILIGPFTKTLTINYDF
jgi:hypothetical protein